MNNNIIDILKDNDIVVTENDYKLDLLKKLNDNVVKIILSVHDESKVADESRYDGLYAVCTDLIDDDVKEILKVSEGRWQIEECFRIMKTDFSARPVYIRRDDRINAHFLICFLSLLIYRLSEKQLTNKYTCEEILDKLKSMKFADIKGQGYMPTYIRNKLTDDLHSICGFKTDYEFITKADMRTIEKKSKQR